MPTSLAPMSQFGVMQMRDCENSLHQTYKWETGTAVDVLQIRYRPHLFYTHELFHVFNQLKDDDFDMFCIGAWEILHIAQCHCMEWHRARKCKGHTLGDAYLHINFQDPAGLEWLAWAIYNRVFIPGRVPEMLGY